MKKYLSLIVFLVFTLLLTSCGDIGEPGIVRIKGSSELVDVNENGLLVNDYFTSIAEGLVVDHTPVDRLGFNGAVGTSSETVWNGSNAYVFPTVAQQMELVSSSAQDSTNGTGARIVVITYLDDTYTERTEEVSLNGTSVVSTNATNILRVNRLGVKTSGSTYSTVGTISLRNLADTPVYRYINAGYTISRDSIYTVPAGYTLFIKDFLIAVGGLNAGNQVRVTLRATYDDVNETILTPGLLFMPHEEVLSPNGNASFVLSIPETFPSTVDVLVVAVADVGSAFVQANWRGWIEPN